MCMCLRSAESCQLIQTGITDPVGFVPHKASTSHSQREAGCSSPAPPGAATDDLARVAGSAQPAALWLYPSVSHDFLSLSPVVLILCLLCPSLICLSLFPNQRRPFICIIYSI